MIERTVGFVGAGKMADALVSGMIASGAAAPERLFVADPAEERRSLFAGKLGANVFADNAELAAACDVLVLSGDPADITAATAAARLGARTMLVERYGYLGGLATEGTILYKVSSPK